MSFGTSPFGLRPFGDPAQASGGGGASQSIELTLDDIAAAFAQVLQHPQSLAISLDGVSVVVAQTLQHSQSLTAALDGVAFNAAQVARHPQALAITLDGVDVAVGQTIGAGNSQAIDFTLDGIAAAVAQVLTHQQSLAATLDGVSASIAQVDRHPQVIAVTLDDVAVSVSQGLRHAQSLSAALNGISVEIAQDFSSPNKDQALAITLDDVSALLQQIGPPPTGSPHGFVITDTAPKLWWQRKPKALDEQEAEEKVAKVVRVVERIARKQVEAHQPVPAKEQKREVREAIAPLVAEMPGFDWMTLYRTILIELGRRQQEQQAAEMAQMEIARIQAMRRDEDDVLILLMSI